MAFFSSWKTYDSFDTACLDWRFWKRQKKWYCLKFRTKGTKLKGLQYIPLGTLITNLLKIRIFQTNGIWRWILNTAKNRESVFQFELFNVRSLFNIVLKRLIKKALETILRHCIDDNHAATVILFLNDGEKLKRNSVFALRQWICCSR